MALFGLVFFAVVVILLGVGIAVGLVGCALAAALLGLGILSSSVFVGLWSRRTAIGIRVFLLQAGLLIGIPAGAVCGWLAQSLFEAHSSGVWGPICGSVGGAFAGLFVALGLEWISRRLHARSAARLSSSGSEPAHAISPNA